MQFERKILAQLKTRIESPEVVVVTGMRRVGKTTALTMLFDEISSRNKAFIDIENPIEQRIFEEKDFILPDMQTGIEVKQTGDSHDLRRVAALGKSLNLREWYVATREYSKLSGIISAQDL